MPSRKSGSPPRRKRIFIIFRSTEQKLADSLKPLFDLWGYKADLCTHRTSDKSTYKTELRRHLNNADLVIILLSLEFRDSEYCQCEAAATAFLQKKYVVLLIPPVTTKDVQNISPILEFFWAQNTNDPNWIEHLKQQMRRLSKAKDKALSLSEKQLEKVYLDKILVEYKQVLHYYSITPPTSRYRTFSEPALKSGRPARNSIIETIKDSLENGLPKVQMAFVGVALKYSIPIIKDALIQFSMDIERGVRKKPKDKHLQIHLIHMDDQSHMLHALSDTRDISTIRETFCNLSVDQFTEWGHLCNNAGIDFAVPTITRIDYVPPRIGILLNYDEGSSDEQATLYAGRCAFEQVGAEFQLLAGELEYLYYTSTDEHNGKEQIRQFKDFLKVYRDPKHNNGVAAVMGSEEWTNRLRHYIECYRLIKKLTIISISATRCEDLIVLALKRGINVDIFCQNVSKATALHKKDINTVNDRICSHFPNKHRADLGIPRLITGDVPQHYRAVLIGDEALGVQMYLQHPKTGNKHKSYSGSPVSLIVSKCSPYFGALKRELIDPVIIQQHSKKTINQLW